MRITVIFFLLLGLFSCSEHSPDAIAEEMCDCVQKYIPQDQLEGANPEEAKEIIEDAMDDNERKIEKCLRDPMEKFVTTLDELEDQEDKADYSREVMNAIMETECVANAFNYIDYEQMSRMIRRILDLEEDEEMSDRDRYRSSRDTSPYPREEEEYAPSICECKDQERILRRQLSRTDDARDRMVLEEALDEMKSRCRDYMIMDIEEKKRLLRACD